MEAEMGGPCAGRGRLVPAPFRGLRVTSASSLSSGLGFLSCTVEAWGCPAVRRPQGHPWVQWLARRTRGTLHSCKHSLLQTQIEIGKGDRRVGQAPGQTRCERPGVLSWGAAWAALASPSSACDDKHRVLPTRDAHLSPGVQSFIGPRSW